MKKLSFLKVAGLGLIALNLSACSSSSWLKNINVSTQQQNNDEVVQVSADLQTGSIALAGLSIPIAASDGTPIGSVALTSPMSGSGTRLNLDFDLSTLLHLRDTGIAISHEATLPNGTPIPVSNVNLAHLMTFPVGKAGSKAYVLYDAVTKQTLIGLALVVDGLNSGVSANLLLPFMIGSLSGSVGPFSGTAAGQSGLALFVNASSALPLASMNTPTVALATPPSFLVPLPIAFKISPRARTADQKKIENRLLELNAQKAQLHAK